MSYISAIHCARTTMKKEITKIRWKNDKPQEWITIHYSQFVWISTNFSRATQNSIDILSKKNKQKKTLDHEIWDKTQIAKNQLVSQTRWNMSTFESNIELSKFFKIGFFNHFGTVSRHASIADLHFNLSKNVTQWRPMYRVPAIRRILHVENSASTPRLRYFCLI